MHWIIFWIKLQHYKGLKLGKNYFCKNVALGFLKQKKQPKRSNIRIFKFDGNENMAFLTFLDGNTSAQNCVKQFFLKKRS